MTLRSIGFTSQDFELMSLPELYLRYCLAYRQSKDNN